MSNPSVESALKQKQQEVLAGLYDKYDLLPTDVFQHKHYQIIRREGIEKIMDIENIYYELDVVHVDEVSCTIKGKYWKEDGEGNVVGRVITTTGSANRGTSQSSYYSEMAEKRVNSRGALKLIQAYKFGIFGEDEFNDTDKEYAQSRRQATANSGGAMFKGERKL